MRILNIIQCTNLGGMEQASLRLMQALQRRGHVCSLISLHNLGALAPALQANGISSVGLGYGQMPLWRLLLKLRRELRRQAPDALLLTGHNLPTLLAIAGINRGHRLLAIHSHHTGIKPAWFWRLYYGLACRMVNAVTFPSNFVRQEAVALCPGLARKAHTLHNPITSVAAISVAERHAARQHFGLPLGAEIIGNAGWLIPRKRFDVFLHTAAAILQQKPDSRFLIAGDGPERAHLEALASELGIAHAVVWIGWVRNMRSFYAAITVLLFNSDWDAMGLTPIEAILQGVPVVSSVLHGGLNEILRPGKDAALFKQHDVPALAKASLSILADPQAASIQTERAREHVLSLSNPDRIAAWHERALQHR